MTKTTRRPHLEVRFASTQKEVESAQRLRFEVFNLEMKKGLASSYQKGLDQDAYDCLCDHLLIVDKRRDRTVGTYRLLPGSRLAEHESFYSESEFDLGGIRSLKKEVLEMGRSCVHKDYRASSILRLLWREILAYVKKHRVGYIIGCPSIYTMDETQVAKIYELFKKRYFAPREFRVCPKNDKRFPLAFEHADICGEEKKIWLALPSLVRSYLKTGAYVCAEPVLDREFGSVDFFMLLDVKKASWGYLRRFTPPENIVT